jgi:COP9 signalosome complex subunit 2
MYIHILSFADALALKEDDAEGALKAFRQTVKDQTDRGEWQVPWTLLMIRGFKALKQMTKMNYLILHRPQPALETYRELLSYTKVFNTMIY